ncbi:LutC/YkgG family protein [Desulfomarina sp.]
MPNQDILETFITASRKIGAQTCQFAGIRDAVAHIGSKTEGTTLVPFTPLAAEFKLAELLYEEGVDVFRGDFRHAGQIPAAGVTFSNFALADTGTVVLDSTDENIRLATTLPEKHFVIVDPATILPDNLAAIKPMTTLHSGHKAVFIAYITGPSRTADIERVLTIGCHGPRELHILIVNNISDDLLKN